MQRTLFISAFNTEIFKSSDKNSLVNFLTGLYKQLEELPCSIHLQIFTCSTSGYIPYPGGGEKWGGNGVGDDLYSYGFDGELFLQVLLLVEFE